MRLLHHTLMKPSKRKVDLRTPRLHLTLSRAQARLDAADSKAEPSFHALTIVRSTDLVCHLWQQYINTAILPLASSSVTLRREMVVFNNQTVSRMESGANGLLQRVTDCKFIFPHATPLFPYSFP